MAGWSAPRPGRCTPGKTRYPLYRRLDGFQGRSGRVRNISPSPGFDPRVTHPVPSLILSQHLHQLVGDASDGALNTSTALRLVSAAWFRICVISTVLLITMKLQMPIKQTVYHVDYGFVGHGTMYSTTWIPVCLLLSSGYICLPSVI